MRLVIERERWLRGEGGLPSTLFRPKDGKMCCLGFYCLALGLERSDIRNRVMPREIYGADRLPPWLLMRDGTGDVAELVEFNDSQHEDEEVRESQVATIFAKHGVEVEFR